VSRSIYIVDDETDVRESLRALLSTRTDLHLIPFASGEAFLGALQGRDPGVVLLNIDMPGQSGVDVLRALQSSPGTWPTIVTTGSGDVAMAVQVMKLGAIDFLEKPFDSHFLLDAIDIGLDRLDQAAADQKRQALACERLASLTLRERDVLDLIVDGAANKVVAARLGLSVRTVELHRAKIMMKLGVQSLAQAIRLVFAAGNRH
jgi:two-component system response regulator FixJ